MNNFKLWSLAIGVSLIFLIIPGKLIAAKTVNFSPSDRATSNDRFCPNSIEDLTVGLLKDLPDYANRVVQKTQKFNRQAGRQTYILTAGKANFEPLNLPQLQYNRVDLASPTQIFFTVLERQYNRDRYNQIQTYHWLFLTQTNSGWHLVSLFSRFGNATDNPPTPPQESSEGIIGQAVKTWLRDCRAKLSK